MQDYSPFEGVAVPPEGFYAVQIETLEPGLAQDGVKGIVQVGCTVQDQDATGFKMNKRVIYSGNDKNGNPLVRQFCDFLNSVGIPTETIQDYGKNGQTSDIHAVTNQLAGKTGYIEARYETNAEGKTYLNIANWVNKDRYDKQVAAGTHRGQDRQTYLAATGNRMATGAPTITLGGQPGSTGNNFGAQVTAPQTTPAGAGLPNL
jgi:hypothetical protein